MVPKQASEERGRRSFVFRLMVNPFTLPAVGTALAVAVVTGIHLGESSIGLINPIYFQGPALHPRERGVAIDETQVRPAQPSYAQLYGWEQGEAARAEDCGDCEAIRARDAYARDYSAEVPYFGGPTEPPAPRERQIAAVEVHYGQAPPAPVEAQAPAEPQRPVVRYAHYPVSFEEAQLEPEAEPELEPDAYPGKFDKE